MNIEHLKYFLVLSECEHYRQAAEQLCISQPGLSHAMASLEAELGVPLFRKKGRNITLNQYGRMLQNDAKKILAMIDKSQDSFSNVLNGGGTLHLTGIPRLASFLLPHLVKNYKETTDSNGNFKLYTGYTKNVIQGVRDGRYDIGFCFYGDWHNELEAIPFIRQQMSVITKPDHPLAKCKSVSLEDTLPYPQIIFSHESVLRSSLDEFWAKIHQYPNVTYEIEQDEMIAEMVACDFGIAVMPNFPNIERHGVIAIPIDTPYWENTFYMVRRKNDYHSPFEIDFWEYCQTQDLLK